MNVTVGTGADADAHVVKLFQGDGDPEVQPDAPEALRGGIEDVVAERDLGVGVASVEAFVPLDGTWTVLVGAGDRDDLDLEAMRRVAAAAARHVRTRNVDAVAYHLGGPLDAPTEARAVVEGVHVGVYEGDVYKDDRTTSSIDDVEIVADGGDLGPEIRRAETLGESVSLVRDLVNEPPSRMTPKILADRAVRAAKEVGLDAEVLDETRLEELGCGGILGVSSGSQEPPRMVVLRHEGAPDEDTWTALVGKGVTFDAGGLSLKSSEGMEDMKTDMAGAAAVIGAMRSIAAEDLEANVIGVAPMAENLPGEEPLKPGDVIEIYDGTTVEVLNTDAEGRLLLADALSWTVDQGVDRIVDAATLTGSVMVALGKDIGGLFGTPDDWRDRVGEAADAAGERVWALPTPDDYESGLDSEIADTKNIGGKYGGSIIAALFLRKFVDDTPWAHLDIAGIGRRDDGKPWSAPGGTGAATRTFVELARQMAGSGSADA